MDKDNILALCDAIDEEIKVVGGHNEIMVNKYTDAIRAEVEKPEPLPETPEDDNQINIDRMSANLAKNHALLKRVVKPETPEE